jgi:predicted nucleic acid-binding protein
LTEPYCFVDTAILVRHITGDIEPLAARARSLFQAIESGQITAEATESVLLETVHVLENSYGADRDVIVESVSAILGLTGFLVPRKSRLLEALELWRQVHRISFPDAYHLIVANNSAHKRIASFDKALDRALPGVTRIEQLP